MGSNFGRENQWKYASDLVERDYGHSKERINQVPTKKKQIMRTTKEDEARIRRMNSSIIESSKRTNSIYKGGYGEMGSLPRPKNIEKSNSRKKPIITKDSDMKTYAMRRNRQKASRGY